MNNVHQVEPECITQKLDWLCLIVETKTRAATTATTSPEITTSNTHFALEKDAFWQVGVDISRQNHQTRWEICTRSLGTCHRIRWLQIPQPQTVTSAPSWSRLGGGLRSKGPAVHSYTQKSFKVKTILQQLENPWIYHPKQHRHSKTSFKVEYEG